MFYLINKEFAMKKKLFLMLITMWAVGYVNISQAAAEEDWESASFSPKDKKELDKAEELKMGNMPESGAGAVKTLYNSSIKPIYIGFYVNNKRFYPWLENGKTMASDPVLVVSPGQTVIFVPPINQGWMGMSTYYATIVVSTSLQDLQSKLQKRQSDLVGKSSDFEIVIAGPVSHLITVGYDESNPKNKKFFYTNALIKSHEPLSYEQVQAQLPEALEEQDRGRGDAEEKEEEEGGGEMAPPCYPDRPPSYSAE